MFFEIVFAILALLFVAYFYIGNETPWISLIIPGKSRFVPKAKFTACDNKFTWTALSQQEHEGNLSSMHELGVRSYKHTRRYNAPFQKNYIPGPIIFK